MSQRRFHKVAAALAFGVTGLLLAACSPSGLELEQRAASSVDRSFGHSALADQMRCESFGDWQQRPSANPGQTDTIWNGYCVHESRPGAEEYAVQGIYYDSYSPRQAEIRVSHFVPGGWDPIRTYYFKYQSGSWVNFAGPISHPVSGGSNQQVAQQAVASYWPAGDVACAMRIVDRESRFIPNAQNPSSGALGLFQIHPTHTTWIQQTYGYSFGELVDPYKNARVARGLSNSAASYYGDRWQPWRFGGAVVPGGGCPA